MNNLRSQLQVGTRFQLRTPSKAMGFDTTVEFTVEEITETYVRVSYEQTEQRRRVTMAYNTLHKCGVVCSGA